ncbi:hypothetical protein [Streptomyces sp. NPDC049906]|uniref:hypothetical protein n=1 Tax=Streptomyces sp. NPDC049906 TaxID=3155656 RepID=UPI00342425DE
MRDDLLDRLSRARLVDDGPCTTADIAAAEVRIAARSAALPEARPPGEGRAARGDARRAAALRLTTLCETVVTHAALGRLRHFLARAMPEPDGALLLGCLLQLAEGEGGEEAARFWWQYAAGAGEPTAVSCLYLHHLALGEEAPASWWYVQQQRPLRASEPIPVRRISAELPDDLRHFDAADASLDTTLRVLNALRVSADWRVPAVVDAVLDYVSAAVAWVDEDVELPLPEAGFTDRIRHLTSEPVVQGGGRGESDLPARRRRAHGGVATAHRDGGGR